MRVYRITPQEYANDLSGNGAKLFGGRWNSEGVRALYCSSSRALALLEILVHANYKTLGNRVYKVLEIEIPLKKYPKIELNILSDNWNNDFIQSETIDIGNEFLIQKKGLALEVPSAVLPDESNFILNPLHSDFDAIKIISTKILEIGKRLVAAV
jgi:RES domain-containing protein